MADAAARITAAATMAPASWYGGGSGTTAVFGAVRIFVAILSLMPTRDSAGQALTSPFRRDYQQVVGPENDPENDQDERQPSSTGIAIMKLSHSLVLVRLVQNHPPPQRSIR